LALEEVPFVCGGNTRLVNYITADQFKKK